jgi:Asp/Glu/hydantoin racemase
MTSKILTLIHTVSWYDKSVIEPFVTPWLRKNPDVRVFNITDDSLLDESLKHDGATPAVQKRIQYYVRAAEAMGANVVMCSCTSMGEAIRLARQHASVPVFNIDEPMARQGVKMGRRFGIVATVPTSPAATRRQLEAAAKEAKVSIEIEVALNEQAFKHRLKNEIPQHDELIHREMERMAERVDVLVLGQISLAQIHHPVKVPVLQVGHSGLAEARRLLDRVRPKAQRPARGRAIAVPLTTAC